MKNVTGRSEELLPKGRKRKALRQESVATVPVANDSPEIQSVLAAVSRKDAIVRMAMGAVVLAVGIWAYFPTLVEMVTAWEREPDYSHGFLVAPMAVFFLWLKRSSFPGLGSSWLIGMLLVLASVAVRLFAGAFFFEA